VRIALLRRDENTPTKGVIASSIPAGGRTRRMNLPTLREQPPHPSLSPNGYGIHTISAMASMGCADIETVPRKPSPSMGEGWMGAMKRPGSREEASCGRRV
jgi:hypothetical protein